MQDDELFAIKDRAAERLLGVPGVTGVGVGGRERGGQPTGEVVIKVFVSGKRPAEQVPPEQLIPAEIEGVPTDVVEMGPLAFTAAPLGRAAVADNDYDLKRRRPLIAGSAVVNEFNESLTGTLGCFLVHETDPNKVYALTNFHIAGMAKDKRSTVGETKIGQPTRADSFTKCCSDVIGRYAGGAFDTTRDVGLIQLQPGTKWKPEILEIGPIRGTHTVTLDEATTLAYAVRKRGIRSRLTGGTVQAIGASVPSNLGRVNDVILVRPNPDPGGAKVFFTQFGDSGSVLVNDDGEIVSLHFSGDPIEAMAASIPIETVLARFRDVESLPLTVAAAPAGQAAAVNVVPGAAMVALPPELTGALGTPETHVPTAAPWLPGIDPPAPAVLHRLSDDLDGSEAGRDLISFWLRHQGELTALVDGNRRVAAVWHRTGGPALLQLLVRMLTRPGVALPSTMHGRPLGEALARIAAAFARHSSEALRTDLDRVVRSLPDLSGLTYPQIIDRLAAD